MNYASAKDPSFLANAEELINSEGEVLLLFRYRAAAGSRDFMFINEMKLFETKVKELPAHTYVVLYGGGQLPVRGQVDDAFIQRVLGAVPDGSEYLVLCLERTIHDYRPHHYWESFEDSAGESHAELIESLDQFRGRLVAVGLWPPWPDESEVGFEAYVPDEAGMIMPGPY
jgi:hypothetical protein